MLFFYIFMFLVFQVVANLFFKWGSCAPHLFWWGFVLGNLVGVSSIIFMIMMYRSMPAALVIAVGTGGTFLLNQIAVFLVYRERISAGGLVGLGLIFTGILLTAFLNQPNAKPAGETPTPEKNLSVNDVPGE